MRQMLRWTVPVDDEWHEFPIASMPVRPVSHGAEVEFWAESDPEWGLKWEVRVFGTGRKIPPGAYHADTAARDGNGLVWHLYARACEEETSD